MPESLRLFILCDAMRWAHLPTAGGLYDQDPQLLEEFAIIFTRRSEYERNKQAAQEAKDQAGKGAR